MVSVSIQALAWALKQNVGNPTRKMVLMCLADRHNGDTGHCFPKLDRIAEEACVSRSTALRALDDLEQMGLIERHHTRTNGHQGVNRYILNLNSQPQVQSVTQTPSQGVTVTPQEPEENLEPDKTIAPTASRRRDEVWDTLVTIFGEPPRSRHARGAWNAACAGLKDESASPEEIRFAYQRFREAWPAVRPTPTALSKHFRSFINERSLKMSRAKAVCPHCSLGGGYHTLDCVTVRA